MLGAARSHGRHVRRFSREHVKETQMPRSAMIMSDGVEKDVRRSVKVLHVTPKDLAGKRRHILGISVDDVIVVQILHARQARTG